MKRLVGEGRGVLMLWTLLAVVSVFSMAAPALATDGELAPAPEVLRQEWGLPLTIIELGVLVAVIVPLVIGVTEFVKQFGVTGKWSRLFAMILGVVIGGLVIAAALDVLPGWAGIAIVILLGGLLAGLAATGLYDLQNKSVKANRELVAGIKAMAEENGTPDRPERDARPICNLCGQQMVRTHCEVEDGWRVFWMCGCESDSDIEERAARERALESEAFLDVPPRGA